MPLPKDVVARNQAGAGGVRYLAQLLVFVMLSYKFWEASFCGVGLKTCWHDARACCFDMRRWLNRWQCPLRRFCNKKPGLTRQRTHFLRSVTNIYACRTDLFGFSCKFTGFLHKGVLTEPKI